MDRADRGAAWHDTARRPGDRMAHWGRFRQSHGSAQAGKVRAARESSLSLPDRSSWVPHARSQLCSPATIVARHAGRTGFVPANPVDRLLFVRASGLDAGVCKS